MNQAEYYHIQIVTSESFESETEHYVRGQRNSLDHFFKDVDKSLSIMDCACGDGVGLQWFKDNGFENVVGVEMNPRKLEKAKLINPNAVLSDMQDLKEIGDQSFDIVWSSHSVEHTMDPLLVLKQFHRVLKPGGKLFLLLPFPDTGPDDVHCGKMALKTNLAKPEEFLDEVAQCGYIVTQWQQDSGREPEIWVKADKEE